MHTLPEQLIIFLVLKISFFFSFRFLWNVLCILFVIPFNFVVRLCHFRFFNDTKRCHDFLKCWQNTGFINNFFDSWIQILHHPLKCYCMTISAICPYLYSEIIFLIFLYFYFLISNRINIRERVLIYQLN